MAHLWLVPLLFFFVAGWVVLTTPKATVVISPAVERLVQPVEVLVRPGETSVDGGGSTVVVGASTTEGEMVVTASLPASGKGREGIKAARGRVTFFNHKGQEVKVPRGTVVATATGERFVTMEEVTVPGVKTEYFMDVPVGLRAGQAEVRIEAQQPGTQGNVAKGRIKVVEGRLAGQLEVINPEPTTGGEDRTFPVVTEEDVARLKKELAGRAPAAALEFLRRLPENQERMVLEQTIRYEVVSLSISQPPGTANEKVEGTARVRATAWVVRHSDLSAAAGKFFQQAVPPGKKVLGEGVQISEIEGVSTTEEGLRLRMNATGFLAPQLEQKKLQEVLAGLPIPKAEEVLREWGAVGSFRIENGSRTTLPRWKGWINVVIENPSY